MVSDCKMAGLMAGFCVAGGTMGCLLRAMRHIPAARKHLVVITLLLTVCAHRTDCHRAAAKHCDVHADIILVGI